MRVWILVLFNSVSYTILGKFSSNWTCLGTHWIPGLPHPVFYNLSNNIRWTLLVSRFLRCGKIFLGERNEFDPRCILEVEETHTPAREHGALHNCIRKLACRSFTFLSWNFSRGHNETVELDAVLLVSSKGGFYITTVTRLLAVQGGVLHCQYSHQIWHVSIISLGGCQFNTMVLIMLSRH